MRAVYLTLALCLTCTLPLEAQQWSKPHLLAPDALGSEVTLFTAQADEAWPRPGSGGLIGLQWRSAHRFGFRTGWLWGEDDADALLGVQTWGRERSVFSSAGFVWRWSAGLEALLRSEKGYAWGAAMVGTRLDFGALVLTPYVQPSLSLAAARDRRDAAAGLGWEAGLSSHTGGAWFLRLAAAKLPGEDWGLALGVGMRR